MVILPELWQRKKKPIKIGEGEGNSGRTNGQSAQFEVGNKGAAD